MAERHEKKRKPNKLTEQQFEEILSKVQEGRSSTSLRTRAFLQEADKYCTATASTL